MSYLTGLGHQPSPLEKATGLVEGFQVAFTCAAILVTVGAILLALLLRSRDVANVNPEQGMCRASVGGPTCSGRRCGRG